jgi:hypothetical protein
VIRIVVTLTSILTVFIHGLLFAGQIRIAWDPNSEEDLAGYRIYYGTASGEYGKPVTIAKETTYTIAGLITGQTYYIAVTAYDTSNNESGYSNEVSGAAVEGPPLSGPWVFELPGKGGAVFLFDESSPLFRGYGIADPPGFFEISGDYSIGTGGLFDGRCSLSDFETKEPISGTCSFDGRLRGDEIKAKLILEGTERKAFVSRMAGEPYTEEIGLPEDWVVRISGDERALFDVFSITPYEKDGEILPHVFRMEGSATIEGGGTFRIDGIFFLTRRDDVSGTCVVSRSSSEGATIRGKLAPLSGRFRFRIKGEQGGRYTFVGQGKP